MSCPLKATCNNIAFILIHTAHTNCVILTTIPVSDINLANSLASRWRPSSGLHATVSDCGLTTRLPVIDYELSYMFCSTHQGRTESLQALDCLAKIFESRIEEYEHEYT